MSRTFRLKKHKWLVKYAVDWWLKPDGYNTFTEAEHFENSTKRFRMFDPSGAVDVEKAKQRLSARFHSDRRRNVCAVGRRIAEERYRQHCKTMLHHTVKQDGGESLVLPAWCSKDFKYD